MIWEVTNNVGLDSFTGGFAYLPWEQMHVKSLRQNWFRVTNKVRQIGSRLRCEKYRLLGMRIGQGARLGKVVVNWPDQVSIGRDCSIADNVVFDFCYGVPMPGPSIVIGNHCFIGRSVEFNITRSVRIGSDCLIAAGARFIDHDHGTELGQLIRLQESPEADIEIGNDVWIGANVVILMGVAIGDGAVVAAGAIVTKSIPAMEVWGGVPARKLKDRN